MANLLPVHVRWLSRAPDEWKEMPWWASCPATRDLHKWGLIRTQKMADEGTTHATVTTFWRRTDAGRAALTEHRHLLRPDPPAP